MSGGHRPGEVYAVTCMSAKEDFAYLSGEGISAQVKQIPNQNGEGYYYMPGCKYVVSVTPAPSDDPVGTDSAGAQPSS